MSTQSLPTTPSSQGQVLTAAESSRQRAELHRTIWQIANDLRGSVDGWDFKQYVLGFLFYRYISENISTYFSDLMKKSNDPNAASFSYAAVPDADAENAREDTVSRLGFFILPSQLFESVRRRAADKGAIEHLNEDLSAVFRAIEGSAVGTPSEDDMKGLFEDLDVNSAKLGNTLLERNERLVKILNAIGDMNLGDTADHQIDAFGDAYEFLMTMYAGNAGKSGGEFFTPQEVSRLLALIATDGKSAVNKVYDPACGSGSLLLQVNKVMQGRKVMSGFFGQEINRTTYNLCRINMFLHHIGYNRFDIALGDTLENPQHLSEVPFDVIVSNPPYSIKWKGDDNPLHINDPRFSPAGILAPKSKADLAFTMHMVHHLSASGTAAIVEFPGVLYRGGAEQKIRQYLIEQNLVDCVIQLPQNLFFGVSIATCIIVLKKCKSDNHVLFIDASDMYVHEGNKNKLTESHIQSLLSSYRTREAVPHLSALVDNEVIEHNGFNLSVNTYVEAKDTREHIDIDALERELEDIVERSNTLRAEIKALVATLR